MAGGFNPLAVIAEILGGIAKVLPPLPPPPPFPLPPSPEVEPPKTKPPSSPSMNYVDVEDVVLKDSMEKHRAGLAAKGLVPFVYE